MAKITAKKEILTGSLVPYARNAKQHGPDQVRKIADSIREFGFLNPVLVDSQNNIIAGHGRVLAAQELGLEKVPCIVIDGLTDEQRRAYILADNRLAELATWDMDLVEEELEKLENEGFNVELTGFDWDAAAEISPVIDEYDADGIPEKREKTTITKRGDIWILGDHRLMCGDSTDEDDIIILLDGDHADISLTSPPYNAGHMDVKLSDARGGGFNAATQKKYINDDDVKTEMEYITFLSRCVGLLLRYSDELFLNLGVAAGSKTAIANILFEYVGNFKDLIYWEKTNPMPVINENCISSAIELVIAFGGNNTRSFNHFNDRHFHGVIEGPSAANNQYADIHKATFPIYFPFEIIKRFTEEGGTVFDCFGGTGTTMIACEQLNRKCYMMEIEPIYCDVIVDRWEQFTGKKAVKHG